MRISILIPAYHAEAFLPAAVASATSQVGAEVEVIVAADDGQCYRRVLDEAGISDARIRHTSTGAVARGPSAARNAALAIATGDLVAPLDADDTFHPERLRLLAPLANAHGAACDDVAVVDASGTVINPPFPGRGHLRWLSAHDIMACGVPLQPVLRSDIVRGWPEDLRFAEDVVFNLQVLSRVTAFPMHWRQLYRYRVHPDSLCHQMDAWRMADAGYGEILSGLERDEYALRADVLRDALAGFQAKRDFNARFGAASEAGQAATFQEFLAMMREVEAA